MTMKLSLDKEALEKLLGDSEFDIVLKNSVVEYLMTKHIKAVCSEPMYRDLLNKIEKNINSTIETHIFTSFKKDLYGKITNAELTDQHKSAINMIIEREFNLVLEEKIKTAVRNAVDSIDRTIEEKLVSLTDHLIRNRVRIYFSEILEGLIKNVSPDVLNEKTKS